MAYNLSPACEPTL